MMEAGGNAKAVGIAESAVGTAVQAEPVELIISATAVEEVTVVSTEIRASADAQAIKIAALTVRDTQPIGAAVRAEVQITITLGEVRALVQVL